MAVVVFSGVCSVVKQCHCRNVFCTVATFSWFRLFLRLSERRGVGFQLGNALLIASAAAGQNCKNLSLRGDLLR